jgi:hypothetical protein
MKRYRSALILLITVTISLLLLIDVKTTEAADVPTVTNAYAFILKLVRYKGNGNVEDVNVKPLFIYNPDIMLDTDYYQIRSAGSYPHDYDQFYDGSSWDISPVSYGDEHSMTGDQIASDDNEGTNQAYNYTVGGTEMTGVGAEFEESNAPTIGDNHEFDWGNGFMGVIQSFMHLGMQTYLYTSNSGAVYGPQRERDPAEGDTGFKEKTYHYHSKAVKARYPRSMIEYRFDFQGQPIEDRNLTPASVENGYVDTLLRRYGGTKQKIYDNFHYTVISDEYPEIYVEAIPVHRVIEKDSNKLTYDGTYTVDTIWKEVEPQQHWTISDWYEDGWECDEGRSNGVGGCVVVTGTIPNESIVYSPGDCPAGAEITKNSYKCENAFNKRKVDCWTCRHNIEQTRTDPAIQLWSLNVKPGKKVNHVINGTLMSGPSYLVLATDSQDGEFLNRAFDSCERNKHCIKKDGACSGSYEYYVGPDKDRGLVGTTTRNPYILDGGCTRLASTLGRQHIWLEDSEQDEDPTPDCDEPSCGKLCQVACSDYAGDKKSDDYLRCSEYYCDAKVDKDLLDADDNKTPNARKAKRNCLIKNCEYIYGEIPPGGGEKDRTSVDSCILTPSPYAPSTQDLTSSCNKVGNDFVQNKKGVFVEDCVGDVVFDYDDDESTEEPKVYEHRTYINKICKEEVDFEFKDLSEEYLPIAGTGFTYPIIEHGNRKCTYFFNLQQWKFDYASAPSRQPIYRKRLLYILEQFNQASKKSEDRTKTYLNELKKEEYFGSEANTYGTIEYEAEKFDFNNSSIEVNIKEKLVDGSIVAPQKQNLVIISAPEGLRTNATLSTIAINDRSKNHVVKVENNTIDYSLRVEKYETDASGTMVKGLPKVCVSTDGKATVYAAPGNGICDTNSSGPIYADNVHYTDFNIKLKNDNPVISNVSVKSKNGSVNYYADEETCNYNVGGPEEGCYFEIDAPAGEKISSKDFYSSSVTANLIYDVPSSPTSVSILDIVLQNKTETTRRIDAETAKITRNAGSSDEIHKLVGEVTYRDLNGNMKTITCPQTISLKCKDCGTCGLGCKIEKIDENYYVLESTGSTNPSTTAYYINTSAKYGLDYKFANKINPSLENYKKSYISLSTPMSGNDIMFGYVRTEDENCNALCPFPCQGPLCNDQSEQQDCTKLFSPTERGDIYNYCGNPENLAKDINNYPDSKTCFKKCSNTCPNDKCSFDKAYSFCDEKWDSLGFDSQEICMHACYQDCDNIGNGDNYLFRTVSVLNPFPNSNESTYPFDKGARKIGANWLGLSNYITYDENDDTTITGPNANVKVEYLIDLTPEDIRKIRQDTISSSNGVNDSKSKRAVYAKLDRVKTSSKIVSEFKSNFLHNSQFVNIFIPKHGKNIEATFKP